MYTEYKKARDLAWKTLIDCSITVLPVNLIQIAAHYNIILIPYSQSTVAQKLDLKQDGFTLKRNGKYIVYYKDILEPHTTINRVCGEAVLQERVVELLLIRDSTFLICSSIFLGCRKECLH